MADELISAERLARIRAALQEVPAPPWHWVGDTHRGPMLATAHSGWKYVMGFRRLGMQGAQPTFPVADEHGYALITSCRDIEALSASAAAARGELIPRAPYDPDSVRGIDNPVARWMQNSPAYVADLLSDRNALARELADKRNEKLALQQEFDDFAETCGQHTMDRDAESVELDDLRAKVVKALGLVEAAELGSVGENYPSWLSALKDVLG